MVSVLDRQVAYAKGIPDVSKTQAAPLSTASNALILVTDQDHSSRRLRVLAVPASIISLGLSPWSRCGTAISFQDFAKTHAPAKIFTPISANSGRGVAAVISLLWVAQSNLEDSMRELAAATSQAQRQSAFIRFLYDLVITKNYEGLYYLPQRHMQCMHDTSDMGGPAYFAWRAKQMKKQHLDEASLAATGILSFTDHCPLWVQGAEFSGLQTEFHRYVKKWATSHLPSNAFVSPAAREAFVLELGQCNGYWLTSTAVMVDMSRGLLTQLLAAGAHVIYLNTRGQRHPRRAWDFLTRIYNAPALGVFFFMEGFYEWCAECGIPWSAALLHSFWLNYAQHGFGGGYNFGVQESEEDPFKRAGVTKVVLDVLYAQGGRASMYPVSRGACIVRDHGHAKWSFGVWVPCALVLAT